MLKQKLEGDLKQAMKAGEALKLSVLRMVLTAISNREIELLKKEIGLSDVEVVDILRKEFKKRKDSSQEFRRGGREDLAEKEEKEASIITAYLPAELSDSELERIVRESVREVAARGPADFGLVMKAAMAVLKGKAGGDRVSEAVKKVLASGG
ncbi:MAG: GatB/YqeY domain-containing protein [Candidatus Niyogibacteria bacterium]|nr:GatB/YqeY domain-containing protein [Candidatus Niyogibacteria bacterium]